MGTLFSLLSAYGTKLAPGIAGVAVAALAANGCMKAVHDLDVERSKRAEVAQANDTLRTAILNKDKELAVARSSSQRHAKGTVVREVYDEKGTLREKEIAERDLLIQELMEQAGSREATPDVKPPTPSSAPVVDRGYYPLGAFGAATTRLGYGGGLSYELLSIGALHGSLGLGALSESGRLTGMALFTARIKK
jgi:hypothetical protein